MKNLLLLTLLSLAAGCSPSVTAPDLDKQIETTIHGTQQTYFRAGVICAQKAYIDRAEKDYDAKVPPRYLVMTSDEWMAETYKLANGTLGATNIAK
jgi:hypothetical protein